jgi:hypothetical protein
MSETLGVLAFEPADAGAGPGPPFGPPRPYGEVTAARMDDETARLIEDAYTRAVELLRTHREMLDGCALPLGCRRLAMTSCAHAAPDERGPSRRLGSGFDSYLRLSPRVAPATVDSST